jgi:hypothetical protein
MSLGDDDSAGFLPEFRDVPTSTEHGAFIAYFDVVLWVSLELVDFSQGDEWDDAERRIRLACECKRLVAFGYRPGKSSLSRIRSKDWPSLYMNICDGQPAWDRELHGSREYGECFWRDPSDEGRLGKLAWSGVCFRKDNVLKIWPETRRMALSAATRSEGLATRALASQIERDPDITRGAALRWCRNAGYELSDRRFQGHVWPSARERAGLPAKAPPGRKPESSR